MYANVYPLSQAETYQAETNVDFLIDLPMAKLVPGSIVLEGNVAVFPNVLVPGTPYAGEDILYDGAAGWHALFRDITTETQNQGVLETLMSYPRLVKMTTVATQNLESLAVESVSSIEGKVSNEVQARGILYGRTATDPYIPFSVKPLFALNACSAPVSGTVTGQIRVRVRLAGNSEVLYGTGFTSGSTGYIIKNLRMRYVTVPEDGKNGPIQMQVYQTYRSAIDSNNANISVFIPGQVDSVHMSFIPQVSEGTPQRNYLQLAVPPGKPIYGLSNDTYTGGQYGISRLYYAVNDVDSALVGFVLESQQEIVFNGLRSFNASADKYATLIRKFNQPVSDNYIAGIPFGGLIDFSKSKFAMEIQSDCTNVADSTSGVHICYLYARTLASINA
jgi:hypothetical protein